MGEYLIIHKFLGDITHKLKADIVVCVYYRQPDQEESVDEALYRQIGAASHLQAIVFMGNFNNSGICRKDNTAGHTQSRRFLECIDDNFLLQVTEEPTRRNALLDFILANKEGLTWDVKIKGSLGCSDCEMVEFRILRAGRRVKSKITPLDFRKADWPLQRSPWKSPMG
ncbi:hypothetical protein GRJ2_003008700 [Grus japonensis]|uniref:Endonuclease/exonuclease/phosphatase domain-containing protein n=1 Tax=Grus japonensis TaxID=30415 RepID=A0ABC9Y6Q4_GRUJA